jgi:hypothetical protein
MHIRSLKHFITYYLDRLSRVILEILSAALSADVKSFENDTGPHCRPGSCVQVNSFGREVFEIPILRDVKNGF